MRNLQELSRLELGQWTPRQKWHFAVAVVLAFTAMGLALAGQMWRYPDAGTDTPLPGMSQLPGQVLWSLLLGGLMIAAAWFIQGVIVMRLQVAVVISLLVHLLLVLTAQNISLAVPIAPPRDASRDLEQNRELLTLPDYGGMEAPQAQPQNWQLPDNTATPDVRLDPQQRADIDHKVDIEREQRELEHRMQITQQEQMQRQQREQQVVPENAQASIDRRRIEAEMQKLEQLETPEVQTQKSPADLKLTESVRHEREQAVLTAQKQTQAIESNRERTLQAARVQASRSERSPVAAMERVQSQQERAFAGARAVESRAEPTQVAAATSAADIAARERAMAAGRQASVGLPGRAEAAESAPAGQRSTVSSSRAPSRAAGGASAPTSAPSAGGAAELARSQAAGGTLGSAGAQAEAVQVASAGGTGRLALSESSSAAMSSRGTQAAIPSRSQGDGTASAGGRGPSIGTASVAGLTRGQTGAGSGQPQVGAGPGLPTAGRSSGSGGGSLSAAGAEAGSVNVAAASGGNGSGKGSAVAGPVDTNVARSSTGLPTGSGLSGGSAPSAASETGTGRITPAIGGGLAARTGEPSAELGGTGGGTADLGTALAGRGTSLTSDLPAAAIQAEAGGALVTVGPTADAPSGGGGSGLAGPQIASLPRRSAGLPGSSGPPGGSVAGTRSTARPGSAGTGLSARRDSASGPSLEAQGLVANLLKSSVGGGLEAAEARIAGTFSMRKAGLRGQIAESLGGSEASEHAVEAGLDWLARHQFPDGRWSLHAFHEQCRDHRCTAPGSFHADTAATGLALLAFYGAAYTHQDGSKHQETVRRGLEWLLRGQKPNGDLYQDQAEFVWFYSHGMAAIAICEAYGMTKDEKLREPAKKAVDFIRAGQHPEFGGWRYRPQFESDTSVSGWQLMALKSAEISGLNVPREAYARVSKWLDLVESKSHPGRFSYHPSRPESLAMTAEALLMRQYLGAKREDPRLLAGADYLLSNLPDEAHRDAYYWYYATQVMFHLQGGQWEAWNGRLRDMLVNSQLKDGGPGGSWNPDRPTQEKWGAAGGRHYVTCLNLLMLEVYYRHLPLYLELGK